jgi:hypothetical protein
MNHATYEELLAGLDSVRESPNDEGVLRLIVRRPAVDAREVLEVGRLEPSEGLVGDTWRVRGSSRTDDGTPHPDLQLTLMNSRVIALLAGDRSRWPLAGDQLYVDLDLSASNVPAGTRLALGTAVVVVTDQPHTGCTKFAARFGVAAARLLASAEGRALNLRGINARVVRSGVVREGDVARKLGAVQDEGRSCAAPSSRP